VNERAAGHPALYVAVLGSAAGGGFPQWNCRCPGCSLAWAGDKRVTSRTQTSLAVSGDGEHWILLNASPDLRAQIEAADVLHPHMGPLRSSPIAAVFLTGAEIDQVLGLLTLREQAAFALYADQPTFAHLSANPMFEVLRGSQKFRLEHGAPVKVHGLELEPFPVPGKIPLYLEGETAQPDESLGLEVRAGGARLLFVPGCLQIGDALAARIEQADVVLFDGTLFRDDEMISSGAGEKTGRRMGHMPVAGADGSLQRFAQIARREGQRRIYIHINNTNPMLIEGSAERREVEAAGWEIASDDMRITL
jgi:pyrroloquinoline quinone biosynthesis protein B